MLLKQGEVPHRPVGKPRSPEVSGANRSRGEVHGRIEGEVEVE